MSDTFRKEYQPLSEEVIASMNSIKDKADELLLEIDKNVVPGDRSEKSRCLAVAKTNLEQAIMWAVKGITG
jgi:hypothetical protein